MMSFGALWLVVAIVLVAAAAASAMERGSATGPDAGDRGDAHDILRQRLAAGEIDEDEYRQRAELLGSRGTRRSATWLPPVLIVLAVLAFVMMLVSVIGGAGGGWWGPMGDGMGGMMGQRTSGGSQEAFPDADEITVEMTEMAFDPDRIEVTAGEPVNLTVTNRGETFHDLTIDELDVQIGAEPGESATTGLELDELGEYDYHCSVPGHESAGMQGTLTVVEAGS